MSLNLILKRIKYFFRPCKHAEDTLQIADKTAHQCLDKVINRLTCDNCSWSAAQLRGYLRATATPWIDLSLDDMLRQNHRTGGAMAQIRSLSIDILEQMVLQKLEKPSDAHSTKSAA